MSMDMSMRMSVRMSMGMSMGMSMRMSIGMSVLMHMRLSIHGHRYGQLETLKQLSHHSVEEPKRIEQCGSGRNSDADTRVHVWTVVLYCDL